MHGWVEWIGHGHMRKGVKKIEIKKMWEAANVSVPSLVGLGSVFENTTR